MRTATCLKKQKQNKNKKTKTSCEAEKTNHASWRELLEGKTSSKLVKTYVCTTDPQQNGTTGTYSLFFTWSVVTGGTPFSPYVPVLYLRACYRPSVPYRVGGLTVRLALLPVGDPLRCGPGVVQVLLRCGQDAAGGGIRGLSFSLSPPGTRQPVCPGPGQPGEEFKRKSVKSSSWRTTTTTTTTTGPALAVVALMAVAS